MPQQQVPGYVRCDAVHIGTEWTFEVLSEQERVAYLTIETDDGPIHVGLNREEATRLQRKVQLFLQDWPEGQSAS
jgi:hypothetical protein